MTMAERYRSSSNPKGYNAAVLKIIQFIGGDATADKFTCPVCSKHALVIKNGDRRPVALWCFGGTADRAHADEIVAHLRVAGIWPGSTALGPEGSDASE